MADHLTPDDPSDRDDEPSTQTDPDADRSDEELPNDPGDRGVPGGREAQAGDDA